MKNIILILPLLSVYSQCTFCQSAQPSTTKVLFRLYDDNDFLNINLRGTDKAYTNGLKLDIFYVKNTSKLPFQNRFLNTKNKQFHHVHGWSLSQFMFTPNDLSKTEYQANDYSYAGALTVSHSITTYNLNGKSSFETGMTLGIRGSPAMSEAVQKFVHRMIRDEIPQGWHHQLQIRPLLNANFIFEKRIANHDGIIDLLGGTELSAGSMLNALSIYPVLRCGLMNPYFNGVISQFSTTANSTGRRKLQFYFFIKPKISLIFSNALLQGRITHSQEGKNITKTKHDINNFLADVNYGLTFVFQQFAISYTQKPTTAYLKGLQGHNVGNISLYYSW